jgi:hypothetical protein
MGRAPKDRYQAGKAGNASKPYKPAAQKPGSNRAAKTITPAKKVHYFKVNMSLQDPVRGGLISRESVAAHALATFGSQEKAEHWMNRPNPLFRGKTPLQVIEFDLAEVEAELVRIDHGVYM